MGGGGADVLNGGAEFDYVAHYNATAGIAVDLGNAANNTGDRRTRCNPSSAVRMVGFSARAAWVAERDDAETRTNAMPVAPASKNTAAATKEAIGRTA